MFEGMGEHPMQLLWGCSVPFPSPTNTQLLSAALGSSAGGGSGGDTGVGCGEGRAQLLQQWGTHAVIRGLQPTDPTARHDPEQMCSGH